MNAHDTIKYSASMERPLLQALWRGFLGRCPNCGKGKLFRKFLKVVDRCEVCGEELHHHRADDAPAYFVIAIVGHLVVGIAFIVEVAFWPPWWTTFVVWLPLTAILAVALLQPVKGAIVGLQWSYRMHGFDPNHSDDH
jgi:uncharacterized protein (DUF983 family)